MKTEYTYHRFNALDEGKIRTFLNEMSREGFEVVTIFPVEKNVVIVCKRIIEVKQ